jgi:hypothetical protein
MSAIYVVGSDRIPMSTGSGEDVRLALAAWLREQPEGSTPRALEVIDALELRWPSSLFDHHAPYDAADVRAMLAPGWVALVADLAIGPARFFPELDFAHFDRPLQRWWVANLIRIARAWSGSDPTQSVCGAWSAEDRDALAVELAWTPIEAALDAYRRAPTAARWDEAEAAMRTQLELAVRVGAARVTELQAHHARRRGARTPEKEER